MNFFSLSVCDYIKAQIATCKTKENKALLTLPSFPAEVMITIGRCLEADVMQLVDNLIYKIAKPLWEEWQKSTSHRIQNYFQEAEKKGWLDTQGNLTNYRNIASANNRESTAVILGGIDHVIDAASLSDFHSCEIKTIWEWPGGMNANFASWIKKCLNNKFIAYEDEVINHFNKIFKDLLKRVPTDIIRISEFLDCLDLKGAQDGRDAEQALLKGLSFFGLPEFSGYRFEGRKPFGPYLDTALAFSSYGMFLEHGPRNNALKAVLNYKKDHGLKNILFDYERNNHYNSDNEVLDDLTDYIKEGGQKEFERLSECDFVTIQDKILKYRSPTIRPPRITVKKMGTDPLESVLTALWLTLAEFRKISEKEGMIAHGIIRKIHIESFLFKHDCEGSTSEERCDAAKASLKRILGGLDDWLIKYIELKSEKTELINDNVPVVSNLLRKDIDFPYSAVAEPVLGFQITIKTDNDTKSTKAKFYLRLPATSPFRMAGELFQWTQDNLKETSSVPVFSVPYYDELMLAKDNEEASRVLMHGIRSEEKIVVDLLEPVLHELNSKNTKFAEAMKKLSYAYKNFINVSAENGLYNALSVSWDELRRTLLSVFDIFLAKGSSVDTDFGAILAKAFLFIGKKSRSQGMQWIWNRYEPSAAITVLHPALLELLNARIIYLFQCFNAEANKQLKTTGSHFFKKKIWDYYLDLSTIKMPLCGLLKDNNLVFETSIRGENLMHRIGGEENSNATLSTRLLLRYDAFDDEDISDQEMFHESRESLMLFRIIKDYWKLHPHAKDGISLAIYQNQDIQPIIAAINQFICDDERQQESMDAPYHISVTLFSESCDDTGISRWIEQWKERWEAAENHDKFAYYRECRFSISRRIVTPDRSYEQFKKIITSSLEADIAILSNFINAGEQGNRLEKVPAPHDVTSRPIKFPILEKSFCAPRDGRHADERYRVLSNRQFRIATKHLEVMARLKGLEAKHYIALGRGDFSPWQGVIDALHKNTEWVVCIDSSIDERLVERNSDGNVRDLIGFGSGVGSHGELNYTISTEQFHFSDLLHKLKSSISNIETGWSGKEQLKVAQFAIDQAKNLSGLSLIRATGTGQHIRDVLAYAMARKLFHAKGENLCDQFISLDAYQHWFDGAQTKMRPDILWLTAYITEAGNLNLDMRIIECKFGKYSDFHLEKAREQVDCGLRHLIPAFMPRQADDETNRPDARYWWLQLHRLIASKSHITSTQSRKTLAALERLIDGDYSISWGAALFTCWTNLNTENIKEQLFCKFNFRNEHLNIINVSCGSPSALKLCTEKNIDPFKWNEHCLMYACQSDIMSHKNLQTDKKYKPDFKEESYSDNVTLIQANHIDPVEYDDSDKRKKVPKNSTDKQISLNGQLSLPDRILLGISSNGSRSVFWEFGHKELNNRHMLIFGSSGMGKTYAIQCLMNELGRAGQNSLVIDYTNGFLPSQLENITTSFLAPQQHIIRRDPLPVNPFLLQQQIIDDYVIKETHSTAAKRIAAIFKTVYGLGGQQFSVLFNAIIAGMESYGNTFKLDDLLDILDDFLDDKKYNKSTVQSTLSKLKPFIIDKPFASDSKGMGWDTFFKDRNCLCHIFQLTGLDMHSSRLVTEFILWDLYAFVRSQGNKNLPKVVVLDEIQNLDHREDCPLAKYLTEGRKFGLALIMATQTLSNLSNEQQSRLFQAGHKLFFKPAETEMGEYAKVMQNATGDPAKIWIERLSKLKKGECYSLGQSLGSDKILKQVAFKIRITAMEDRNING